MDLIGVQDLKLWFADGTNYPGQDNISDRQNRLAESLAEVYQHLSGNQRMLLEYKFLELPSITQMCLTGEPRSHTV